MGGLAKGLEVLRAFSRARPHMTLSEIAAQAGLPAATARRCLNTLEELGYVGRRGRQFLLCPKVLEISSAYLDSMEIRAVTRTKLEELALASGGSSVLALLSGDQIVFVARASARVDPLIIEAQVGMRMPVHATATGKVLLAGLAPQQQEAFLERNGLARCASRTITDPVELKRELELVSIRGYGTSVAELADDVASIAVPVHNSAGRVVAAINTTVHYSETSGRDLEQYLPALRAASAVIAAEVARAPALALSVQG